MTRDRFERMVEKEYRKWLKGPQVNGWLSISLTLLRAQHRAVLALVKKKMKLEGQTRCVEEAIAVHAYNEGIRDVYTSLRAWGKGK